MKNLLQFTQLLLVIFFLSSCRTSINKDYPNIDSEKNNNEKLNDKKKRIEIKVSCGNDQLSEYIDDGWIILKEDSKEKICSWKSVPATKDCDMEQDKGCKITKPDKIGEEKIYLIMNSKSELLIDLIFNKLKKYNGKKISLEKDDFSKFIFKLLKKN